MTELQNHDRKKSDQYMTGGDTNTGQDLLERPKVRGKFFFVGSEKLYLRGVTYGTFKPDEHGCDYHSNAKEAFFSGN